MMHWFPGLFTIGELQEMDVRISAYWLRQAKIKALEQQMRMTQAARVAQAIAGEFKKEQYAIMQEISILKGHVTRRQIWSRNWEALKKHPLVKKM